MDLRITFNEVPEEYEKWRPTYVPQLFADIMEYSGINQGSRALEIGIGTGQATLPILKTGCHVTAVELGGDLAEYSRRKFKAYEIIEVKNMAFEDYECPDNSLDLVYSATAFHWIPVEIGYPKVYRHLKSGGTLAWFRNHAGKDKENEPLHAAIQKVYSKYMPHSSEPEEMNEDKCIEISNIIKKYGYVDVKYKLYYRTRTYNAEDYVSLINTYSDHLALNEEQRILLSNEMKETINSFGGKINVHDTIDLHLARKP